jgi:hypothetical protein
MLLALIRVGLNGASMAATEQIGSGKTSQRQLTSPTPGPIPLRQR